MVVPGAGAIQSNFARLGEALRPQQRTHDTVTGLLPRGQRINAIEKRLKTRRANHRCVVINFFLAACTNFPDTIGAASCVGHLSFTFSDTHVPYVFLEATRTSEMARPTRQPGVSFPYHRDRSHHARDYWLENGVRTRSSTE